ncbi:MAG: outer membrane lipoprotein-sorting protein [Gammaproteobacteria bacterium]|nr:outer membrane lipoprotein-sorting protein [Gammaproteobacteria bacterium]
MTKWQLEKLTGVFLLLVSVGSHAVEINAAAIMEKIYQTPRVEDQVSTLNFSFHKPEAQTRRAGYTMVWKDVKGKGEYDNKAIFFTEFPIARKGIAYLGWLHPIGSDKKNDEWIYLPELGMTRRIIPRDNSEGNEEDEFAASLLTHEHLEPRPPQLDDHRLLEEKLMNGRAHYLIESKPASHGHGGHGGHHNHGGDAPAKRISWVDKVAMRINRIQFFDGHDKMQLDMNIEWREEGDYWLWSRVEAIEPETRTKTVLEITDIRINAGINERMFHKRNLDKGSVRFR